MIPLVIKAGVRKVVSPETDRRSADRRVLDDLATWTLAPSGDGRRTASVVAMYGRQYRYIARLPHFQLPDGWCVCQVSRRGACECRDSTDRSEDVAVLLLGARPISARDRQLISAGDSYDTPLTRDSIRHERWWAEAAARWHLVQARIAYCPAEDAEDPLPRWKRVVELRRAVVEELAQPLPYEEVDLEDETGLLVFQLVGHRGSRGSNPQTAVPSDVIYEPAGHRKLPARLRTIEVDQDGRLRCELEPPGDPVEIADYAARQRGQRRRLVRDQQATSDVLDREEHVMRDVLSGAAVNPQLLGLLRRPRDAALDSWLAVPEHLFQPQLDASQRQAVEQALRARHLLVVQGPPGTGKTTFIAELVLRHLHQHPGDTVLIASQTNQATDNLLRRVHRLDPDLPLVRVGNERKIAEDVLPFWLHASEPWRAGVRIRAERYRRLIHAQASIGEWDDDVVEDFFAIQDAYLASEGAQRSGEQRLAEARIVAGTCYGVSKNRDVREGSYALAILEEAGKALPAEALMAMLRAHKVVLVGDSRQLPPTRDRALDDVLRRAAAGGTLDSPELSRQASTLAVDLDQERDRLVAQGDPAPPKAVAETLFDYLGRRLRKERPELEVTLTTQYRMVSGIGELISRCFYDGELQHGRLAEADEGRDLRAKKFSPAHVRLVNVPGEEDFPPESKSAFNLAEVGAVAGELRRLSRACTQSPDRWPLRVAIITGYAAQLGRLRSVLGAQQFDGLEIRTGLVDQFQGDEDEVVVVSATRTDKPGFLYEYRRINVALSRARSLLIVCAHLERARAGRLGKPLRDVMAYVDEQLTLGDDRYAIAQPRGKS